MTELKSQLDIKHLRTPYPHLLGWWDRSLAGTTLGTLVVFLAECGLITRLCNASSVDIAVNAATHGVKNILEGDFRLLDSNDTMDAALSVLDGIEIVKHIYLCDGNIGFQALSLELTNTHLTWPLVERIYLAKPYDTTLYVQKLWKETGRFESLKFHSYLREWASKTIRNQFGQYPVVGLHLKQMTGFEGTGSISLADELVWGEFLSVVAGQYRIKFLLLGDDPVGKNIKQLPNIILAREIGADSFTKHLALLAECAGFMGMMSSVCNFALFSDIPYAIFKNPEHHKNEMLEELAGQNNYLFATQFQRVLRVKETPALLLAELARMPFAKER
jgi:hypothetical protein